MYDGHTPRSTVTASSCPENELENRNEHQGMFYMNNGTQAVTSTLPS